MVKINLDADMNEIVAEVETELNRAIQIKGRFISEYEAFGALTEEYFEVIEAFRKSVENQPERNTHLHIELVQLAAMCRKWHQYREAYARALDVVDQRFAWQPEKKLTRTTMEALGSLVCGYEELKKSVGDNARIDCKIDRNLLDIYSICVSAVLSLCTRGKS